VARSIQPRRSKALGFDDETWPERKPEIPATRTEVSITHLGRLERGVGNGGDLGADLAPGAVFPQ
jgi:hypothetical protein